MLLAVFLSASAFDVFALPRAPYTPAQQEYFDIHRKQKNPLS